MKRLISLSLISILLTSCGGPYKEDSNEILDGILDGYGETEEIEVIEYDTPLSEGPSALPDSSLTE